MILDQLLTFSHSLSDKINNRCNYRKIFLLDRLPSYTKDYARVEDDTQAAKIHQILEETYCNLPFPVVRVPALSIEERVDFILKNLDNENKVR